MNNEKSQTTRKKPSAAAKRGAVRPAGLTQKKDIQALLKKADNRDYTNSVTDTLTGRIVFRAKDRQMLKKLKSRYQRNRYMHHVIIDRIKEGIEASAFEMVTDAYGIPMSEGYNVMGIAQSTLRRRLKDGKLHPGESDRVYRYAELMTIATDMMQQDSDRAATWFKTPMDIFEGETPLQHAMTEVGARDVEDLIGRIRHGVFS